MKVFVKTLNGIHFQIEVNPHHTVSDVKKNIESVQGANTYPASQQILLYQGKVLTDGTTLEENRISENSFIVVMLCKSKIFSGEGSVAATAKPTSKSKSLFGVTSVAAAAAKLTSKIKNYSKGSSVAVDATPTSKSKRSSEDSSVAAAPPKAPMPISKAPSSVAAAPPKAPMPISKSKRSSEDSPVAAAPPKAPMPISKSKSSSEKSSVSATPVSLSKSKSSSGESSVAAAAAAGAMTTSKTKSSSRKSPVAAAPMPTSKSKSSSVDTSVAAAAMPTSKAHATLETSSFEEPTTPSTNVIDAPVSPVPVSVPTSMPSPIDASSVSESYVNDQAALNLAAGDGLENTIRDILDMGGGVWDRDAVIRALHAAFNNPERAVEYLYSGIPEQPEAGKHSNASTMSQQPTQITQPATVPSSQPNAANAGPLNNFSQGLPTLGSNVALSGPLDFLRNSEQFQALRAMVQANPETLQPMLQELGKQNPNLMRLIQEHPADFQRLLNEPVEGEQGDILERFAAAMPQSIQVTPGEHAAIERLEAMGFDRSTVLEAYFACNKNEVLTANFLLDHIHEFED